MPASLYRLANKPHHTEIPVVNNRTAQEIEATHIVSNVTTTEGESQSHEPQIVQDVSANDPSDPTAEASVASWDPGWTKTKLLDFALSLGLSVSSTSTKTEIINALTTATVK